MNSHTTPNRLITKITPYLPTAEKIFLMGIAIGIVLTLANLDSLVLNTSLVGLAVTFFFHGYKPIDVPANESEKFGFVELLGHSIAPNVAWVGCAVSTIGVLFTMQNSEGHRQMLFIGGTSLAITSLIIVFLLAIGIKYMNSVVPVLYRAIPLLILDVYLFFK
jgi:hypothetical protein